MIYFAKVSGPPNVYCGFMGNARPLGAFDKTSNVAACGVHPHPKQPRENMSSNHIPFDAASDRI
jgi:hypothetical protein